ncbi:2-amino-4-hydroxy-6-hydroxymethyldihydropteridine diphosphokinase [Curvibacter sp. APW13]|uniref:2-amino-4-hydroxy-6- hydroxymethyldihydropteridine diphosphokinase n=1 Tax=Curvibacter sp. APW13 TaxID=3077236 RepID=UPI0028DEFF82|nr:2-amino-4-hydroxy-6-hydroxymethyldihydropteridine diphosphokinase [Curvibacter sp. APW13]MDT8991068.1 2-amino-4-hydroxy-6-hydroxymethyldihydropteridine diphosphokinase [Curvibacter sp. APW13]
MVTAYIGLGGNLGDAQATLQQTCAALRSLPGGESLSLSSLYASAPIDSSGPDYLNAVASLDTPLAAEELLRALQAIEQGAGRERPYRNAPRTLDLDVLLYGDEHIQSPTLIVPHPRMWERAFVLLPLAELAPSLVPADLLAAVAGQSIRRLPGWA